MSLQRWLSLAEEERSAMYDVCVSAVELSTSTGDRPDPADGDARFEPAVPTLRAAVGALPGDARARRGGRALLAIGTLRLWLAEEAADPLLRNEAHRLAFTAYPRHTTAGRGFARPPSDDASAAAWLAAIDIELSGF